MADTCYLLSKSFQTLIKFLLGPFSALLRLALGSLDGLPFQPIGGEDSAARCLRDIGALCFNDYEAENFFHATELLFERSRALALHGEFYPAEITFGKLLALALAGALHRVRQPHFPRRTLGNKFRIADRRANFFHHHRSGVVVSDLWHYMKPDLVHGSFFCIVLHILDDG